jgi:hypothetical protein
MKPPMPKKKKAAGALKPSMGPAKMRKGSMPGAPQMMMGKKKSMRKKV